METNKDIIPQIKVPEKYLKANFQSPIPDMANDIESTSNNTYKISNDLESLKKELEDERLARIKADKKSFRNSIIASIISGIIVLIISVIITKTLQ